MKYTNQDQVSDALTLLERLRNGSLDPKKSSSTNNPDDKKSSNTESGDPRNLKDENKVLRDLRGYNQNKPSQEQLGFEKAKALGVEKAKIIVEDILDLQINGYEMAMNEIQDKIRSLQEEESLQQDQNNAKPLISSAGNNRVFGRFFSQKPATLNPRQEELKMLADMFKDSKEKVGKLNIKKSEEDFKNRLVEIMSVSQEQELDSYNNYDAKRKEKKRVFILPKEQVMSLSEIFGQADIKHEVAEVPANQVQNQGLAEQNNSGQNQDQQNQAPQEQVMVIVVNDPQIVYQQQYQQGKEQISQGGSWVETVKNRGNQVQSTNPSQSTNQVQNPSQGFTQSQLQAKPVVGKFTETLQNQRAALVVMSRGKI
jgi:hypothetical protein